MPWRDFKLAFHMQKTLAEPAQKLATPYLINLIVDPKERKPFDFPYVHSWTSIHFGKILKEFAASVRREPLIPAGAPLVAVSANRAGEISLDMIRSIP